jgi:predicted XRE-type DNA-binding protein
MAAVQAFLHARDCLGEPLSQRQLSAAFGLSRPKVAELVGPLNGTAPTDLDLN